VTNYVALEDVAQINPRPRKCIDEMQEVSFLPMASVSANGFVAFEEKRILKEVKKGFTPFRRGDFIIAKITPCFENGKAALTCNLENEIGYGSTEFHVVRPDEDKLDRKYLYYLLWNKQFRFFGKKEMRGAAGQKRITTDYLKGYKIPLPPLEEQKRIAAILDKADAVRRKRQQAIDLTDQLLRSVFLDMFGDPVTNPKSLEVVKMSDIGQIITGNTPSRKSPEYYGSNIEWIKSGNINTPYHYLTQAEECLSEQGAQVGRTVPRNSILVTCIAGSKDCIGNIAIADREVAFNQQINAIVPNEKILTLFLYAQLAFNKKLVQKASTKSMKGMVSKSKFSDIEVLLPPIKDQKKYADCFLKALSKIEAMKMAMNNCNNLFNSLTQQAFKGELIKQAKAA